MQNMSHPAQLITLLACILCCITSSCGVNAVRHFGHVPRAAPPRRTNVNAIATTLPSHRGPTTTSSTSSCSKRVAPLAFLRPVVVPSHRDGSQLLLDLRGGETPLDDGAGDDGSGGKRRRRRRRSTSSGRQQQQSASSASASGAATADVNDAEDNDDEEAQQGGEEAADTANGNMKEANDGPSSSNAAATMMMMMMRQQIIMAMVMTSQ